MQKLKFGSLFAGIGGFDLGLERAGFECSWQVEIDPLCQKILSKHWPEVRRYSDVKDCGKRNLSSVDLICGGFPCQPVSTQGKQKGQEDQRWLWPEFARIICEVKPRWILAENVPGLLSVNDGRAFGEVLRDLSGFGYDAEWHVIPASNFGAPHARNRLWILAYPNGWRCNGFAGIKANHQESNKFWINGSINQMVDIEGRKFRKYPEDLRMVYGVSPGLDEVRYRTKMMGNAVVPQIVEFIGNQIMAAENDR